MIFKKHARNVSMHTCPWWWDASLWAHNGLAVLQDTVNDGFESAKDVLWKHAHVDETDGVPDEQRPAVTIEGRDAYITLLEVTADVLAAVDGARWLIKQREGSSVQVADR